MMLKFNGYVLSDLLFCDIDRPVAPPLLVDKQSVTGRDGQVATVSQRDAFTVVVHCRARHLPGPRGTNPAIRHLLAKALDVGGPAPLVLPDEPHVYYLAVPNDVGRGLGAPAPTQREFDIEFLVTDPAAYGNLRVLEVQSGTTLVDFGGNYPTRPVFTADVEAERYRAGLDDDSAFVRLLERTTGHVEIDMGEHYARVGDDYVAVDLQSDYFGCEGPTLVKVNAPSTITWRERWL